MVRQRMSSVGLRLATVVVVAGAAAVIFAPTVAEGAASAVKSVVIGNDASNPVPVVSPAPVLRSGHLDLAGSTTEPVPAGVVLTDLLVWHMTAGCEVRLHQGDDEGIRLAPTLDAAQEVGAELHLQTGLPSTSDQPLTLRSGGGPFCPGHILASWTGYER
jgi:hypothetical protein